MAGLTQPAKRPRGPAGAVLAAVSLLGSAWPAWALMAAVFGYLAVASVWPPPPGQAPGTPSFLYGWFPLKVLGGLVVASMLCATVTRVPLRWASLGTWLAHAGVVVLACGSVRYVAGSVSGFAVAFRHARHPLRAGDDNFLPVRRFFLNDTAAVYVEADRAGAGRIQTPVPGLLAREGAGPLNLPVRSPDDDVSIRVRDYLPAARMATGWRDDGPAEVPAAGIVIRDGPHVFRRVLCPAYPFAREFRGRPYAVRFARAGGEVPPWLVEKDSREQDIVVLARTPAGRVAVRVLGGDGSRRRHQADVGEEITLRLAGRDVLVTVERLYTRAWRAWTAYPAEGEGSTPAAKLRIAVGGWVGWQWVRFDGYLPPAGPAGRRADPLPDSARHRLPLPDGRTMWVHLAPRSRPLARPFRVRRLAYRTYPGSAKPRDYVCWLEAGGQPGRPAALLECRMNHPVTIGGMRIYQNAWSGQAASPQQISFTVASRPGIPAVWAGGILICLALPYAFYVKPVLRRRGRQAAA